MATKKNTQNHEEMQTCFTPLALSSLDDFFKSYDYFSKDERTRLQTAYLYLLEKTKNLHRSSGEPYFEHPYRVAEILAQSKLDADSIIAAFFHNIFELNIVSESEIENLFGKTVLNITKGTAKITSMQIKSKTMQEAASFRKMLFAMVDDIRIILVKMADRLDRMRHLKEVSAESQKKIAQEVIDIWAPLANRLGMSNVKSELEDLSLKYTNPDVFQQLKQLVALKKSERSEYLLLAQKEIYSLANKHGIEVAIRSRAKHFYSIYQKMKKRNKAAEDMYDLLALRILCETNADCYSLIGLVHTLWKPLEGRFKDYIAMPKANGYQSLHTTVMSHGHPLEIQIRTYKMHEVAEHGVASHWLYKEGLRTNAVNLENVSIINQLRELKNDTSNSEQAFNELRDELLGDSIFVFTPKGDVRELPQGATAIDFAYSIHSRIGETIIAAKANGAIIPLSKPLKNTQIIDIITSPKAHPTWNQLRLVKTQKARSKINAYLNEHDQLRIHAEKQAALEKQQAQERQAALIKEKALKKESKEEENKDAFKIRIGDTSNFLVTLARCCNPVFGDPIVGYVSRGRGLIVHKASCRNFSRIPNINERSIEVLWET